MCPAPPPPGWFFGAATGAAAAGVSPAISSSPWSDGAVGDGLEDLHVLDLGHGGRGLAELAVGALGDDPGVDPAAAERVDVVGRGDAGQRLAEAGERGKDHVRAHRRHLDVVAQRDRHLHDAPAVGHLGEIVGRLGAARLVVLVGGCRGGGLGLLVRVADEALQALDQRLGLDLLGAGLVDRVDGGGEGVQADEEAVDRVAREAAATLLEQLEDVLHLVREGGHAGEAHRRAHALHRVSDAEDLVDRLLVVGGLLDTNDGEIELLEVLAALSQEHGEVLGGLHQLFR